MINNCMKLYDTLYDCMIDLLGTIIDAFGIMRVTMQSHTVLLDWLGMPFSVAYHTAPRSDPDKKGVTPMGLKPPTF